MIDGVGIAVILGVILLIAGLVFGAMMIFRTSMTNTQKLQASEAQSNKWKGTNITTLGTNLLGVKQL